MARNVEFDYISSPSPNEIKSITAFFEYCDLIANEVNAEVIQYYKNNQAKISELHHAQKKLTATLTSNEDSSTAVQHNGMETQRIMTAIF